MEPSYRNIDWSYNENNIINYIIKMNAVITIIYLSNNINITITIYYGTKFIISNCYIENTVVPLAVYLCYVMLLS